MKTVVGLFESLDDAQSTMGDFARLGLSAQNIGLLSGTRSGAPPKGSMSLLDLPGLGQVAANAPMLELLNARVAQRSPEGALGALVKMGVPKADASRLVDGVKRGGTLEALVVDDEKEAQAREIMQRRSGDGAWHGESADDDIIVPVIREEMVVGKREVNVGGVRITTHVTVRPVEKAIAVHEERVNVERRMVNRPVGEADNAFQDTAWEMKASFEEPYITKRAHVVEEIRVHKGRNEHVEKVHDTLRQTEVEVSEIPTERQAESSFDESPAYSFGAELARRMPGREWASVEPEAKAMWESKNPSTWEYYRAAIKVGFHNLRH